MKATGISGSLFSWLENYLSNRTSLFKFLERNLLVNLWSMEYHKGPFWDRDCSQYMLMICPNLYLVVISICSLTKPRFLPLVRIQTWSSLHFKNFFQLHTWCTANRLIAHESKTEAMIISRSNFIAPQPALTYGTKTIELKSSSKCLGLTTDNRLSWQDHIRNICKLFNKKLAILKRIKFLPHSILESIYFNSVILSVVYNIVVWGSVSSALMKDIERIHIRVL